MPCAFNHYEIVKGKKGKQKIENRNKTKQKERHKKQEQKVPIMCIELSGESGCILDMVVQLGL